MNNKIPPNAIASKINRGNKAITFEDASVLANVFAGSEKLLMYICSNPPTLISFVAPKASLTAVKRN